MTSDDDVSRRFIMDAWVSVIFSEAAMRRFLCMAAVLITGGYVTLKYGIVL